MPFTDVKSYKNSANLASRITFAIKKNDAPSENN